METDENEDNYSPVAAWATVRSFLIISIIRKWITTSIDFSNAFVQSKLPKRLTSNVRIGEELIEAEPS